MHVIILNPSSGRTVSISNSLFAPTEVTIGTTRSATFARNGATITNCYYTEEFNDGENYTAQGTGYNFDTAPANIGTAGTATVSDADEGLKEVQMVGCYSPVPVEADDKSTLFLGEANTLYYSTIDNNIRSCRAYFSVPYIKGHAGATVRAFHLDFGDGEAQGITTTDYTDYTNKADAWYTLDGVKLDKAPTRKGLYIRNGKKVVVK